MARSTAIPEIYSTVHMSSKNLPTSGNSTIQSCTTSSPEYPQSNGAAERAVQTAKRTLKKVAADHKDPFEGLHKYRNTPFQDIGVSPVQLLMSR